MRVRAGARIMDKGQGTGRGMVLCLGEDTEASKYFSRTIYL